MRYVVLLMLLPCFVYASRAPEQTQTAKVDFDNTTTATVGNVSGGDSHSVAESAAFGGHGGEGGTASAQGGQGGNSTASGGSVGDISILTRARSTIRNTPAAIAPDIYPSVSCFRPSSAAGSAPGISLSVGGGRIDRSCVRRETIRIGHAIGLVEQAQAMWCAEAVKMEAFDSVEACLDQSPPSAPPAYTDEVMYRLESAESAQLDLETSLQAEIEALKAELHKEKARRIRASQAAQERREALQGLAKEYGIGE